MERWTWIVRRVVVCLLNLSLSGRFRCRRRRSGGSFSNDDGDGNENVKKSDYIRLFSLYVYLLSRLRRENTLFHVLWRTLTSDDEYFFLFLNLSAVSKKSERNSPTFSAKWNKRDKVWKTRIHYKVTFSLPWPSSSLKLLSFVRFLNSRDPFIRSTPPFHRPGRVRLRWSVILTFPSVDEILWCCCGRRSVWFCWNVWSF